MFKSGRIVAVGLAGLFATCFLSPKPAIANTSSHQKSKTTWQKQGTHYKANAKYHRHYRRHTLRRTVTTRNYHRTDTDLARQYGTYPNIQYFRQNGHVYYRDLNTGQNYLVKW